MTDVMEKLIASHPSTKELIKLLKGWPEKKGARFVLVNGLFSHLQKHLIRTLEGAFGGNLLVLNRATTSGYNYLETLTEYGIKSFKYNSFIEILEENFFEKEAKVLEKGKYSVKGEVISFWPVHENNPIRIIFFGKNPENIESFDEVYGTKINSLKEFYLGDINKVEEEEYQQVTIGNSYEKSIISPHIIFSSIATPKGKGFKVKYDFNYPQLFFQRFDILEKEIERYKEEKYDIKVITRHEKQLPKKPI